jgi:hypothetical protein
MKAKKQNKIVNWDTHLDRKYGKRGTPTREKYAEEFESFKIDVLTGKPTHSAQKKRA